VDNDRRTYWDLSRAFLAGATTLTLLLLSFLPLFAQDQLLPVLRIQRLEGYKSAWVTARIVRDSLGFVWIGTENGLQRFDGYDYKEYRHVANDSTSLSSSRIQSLLVDSKQRLWVGTVETGLSLYDRAYDRFINFYPHPEDPAPIERRIVFTIIEDQSGSLWLATAPAGLVRVEIPAMTGADDLDSLARGMHFRRLPLGTPLNSAYDICERKDGKILVASDSGLFILDPATYELSRPYLTDPLGRRLDSLAIICCVQDSDGNLWLGTATQGLFRVDWNTRKVANYRHRYEESLSIKVDDIADIAADRRGNLWVANVNGIDLFSPAVGHCIPYLTFYAPPGGAKAMALSVDRTGTLWVGTASGAYRLSPRSQLFQHFSVRRPDGSPRSFDSIEPSPDGNPWCFSEGKLFQLDIRTRRILKTIDVSGGKIPQLYTSNRTGSLRDTRGNLWYGANNLGLYRVNLATGRVKNYRYESRLGALNRVRSIVQGSGDTLLIAAVEHGLMKFDPASGRFLKTQFVPAANVMKDHDGKIWIATEADGLRIYDPVTGTTNHLYHDPSNPGSLSHNTTVLTYEDPSGRVWVGVGGNEVHLWNPATGTFTCYPNPAFNDASEAYPIGSDKTGRLWIWYSYGGLSILNPSSGEFTSYDVSEGVCSWIYDMECMDDGRVLLAGTAGVNIVSPDSIDTHRAPPALIITRLAINDEPVVPPLLLKGSGSLHLSHTQDVLEFEFAALDIDAPQLVQYQYQLEGLESDWVKPKGRRFVRYTAIPPGDYVFKVRAASSRGEWPEQEIAFAVSIAPPWWRTTWAYTGYGLFIIAILFGGYRLRLRQIQLKQAVKMEHFQAEHLAEVDRLKSRFFSNISHEFRTPLTLILGPADQLTEITTEPSSRQKLGLIKDNAKKLFALVNQLLDFSRLESGMMRLQVTSGDIVPFLRRVVMSFESWAERKHTGLEFQADAESIRCYFDADKLEKIVNNLISNALKFMSEGGAVFVQVTASPNSPVSRSREKPVREGDGEKGGGGDFIAISVRDTGPGIAAEHLPHIFDRFYRVDETHTTEGTGIGLALTKELVDLHHGTITVESTLGKGSVFTVAFPIEQTAYAPNEITESVPQIDRKEHAEAEAPSEEPRPIPTTAPADGKPVVLIVEDNADLRAYIREYLEADYAVQEAGNGKEGYDQATEIVPDIVISDIMMPQMDGMGLCRALKQDVRTSHVPVILLTARAGTDSKIEGLEIGADDYVTKPFETKELGARVRNLIEQRRLLRKKFSAGVVLKPGEVAVTSLDDALLKNCMEIIEKNIGDENFAVDDLAREACLSRSHLNRKLQALTNLAPAEFIRYVRLQRAHELLEKNAGTVAEVAYQVGFGSPSYFSTCFHERFGVPPSEVQHKSGAPNNTRTC
jgi:signal transduction histidine kinase/ligand-binding sensor domain-containing protein/DNA-binding response OmpR family regulator